MKTRLQLGSIDCECLFFTYTLSWEYELSSDVLCTCANEVRQEGN